MPRFLTVCLLLFAAACSKDAEYARMPAMHDFSQVTAGQWKTLSQRTFYFGHQSVGANIIEGVREISAQKPEIRLRVVSGASAASAGALNEFLIGRNEEPESKNTAIIEAPQGPLGPNPVLMFKYCYIDVDDKTDPVGLFEHYRQTVATLRRQHPEAIVVHVTLPLMTEPSMLRYVMNKVRGMATNREENAIRAEYNGLLRVAYAGREPLFDLAALEATHADGTLEYGVINGAKIPALASEWSSDGGHLSAAGRRRVAEQFLATLATLPAPGEHAPDPR